MHTSHKGLRSLGVGESIGIRQMLSCGASFVINKGVRWRRRRRNPEARVKPIKSPQQQQHQRPQPVCTVAIGIAQFSQSFS